MTEETPRPLSRRELLFGFANGLRKNVEAVASAAGVTAAQSDPTTEKTKLFLDTLAKAQGAYDEDDLPTAVRHLRDAIRIDLDYAPARLLLGFCLFRQGAYVQARVEFDRALRLKPEDNIAALYAGLTHARLGRLESAREHWAEAPWTDPALRDFLLEQLGKLEQTDCAQELDANSEIPTAPGPENAGDPLALVETYIAQRGDALLPPPVAKA
jgi:tetratricopeptide (TPR) repeat protein